MPYASNNLMVEEEILVSFTMPAGEHFACSFPCASFMYLAKEKIRAQKVPTVSPRKGKTYTKIHKEGEAVCELKADESIRERRADKG